jgi:serine/threonine-protein kinase RsbW
VNTADRFRLEFSSDPRFISTARLFASAVARYFDCDEETVDDIKLAISEACTNAVKAPDALNGKLPVGILVHPEDSAIEFAVVDRAGGFDETAVTPPDDLLAESGVGLQIIRSLFPQAVVEHNPDGGTTVRFAVACDGQVA